MSRYQIAANTPLQMLLYFNVLLSFVWGAMHVLYFQWKSANFEPPLLAAVITPMIFWGWALLEPIRLLLGWVGNIGERVAWLSGFWVLTCFPQLVVHIFFLFGQDAVGWFSEPLECASARRARGAPRARSAAHALRPRGAPPPLSLPCESGAPPAAVLAARHQVRDVVRLHRTVPCAARRRLARDTCTHGEGARRLPPAGRRRDVM